MTISRSRRYIDTNPRFALIGDTRVQRGQETMVHKAFAPNPQSRSLEELAAACLGQDYEQSYKRPIPSSERWLFLRMSILYHLRRMQAKNIIREL